MKNFTLGLAAFAMAFGLASTPVIANDIRSVVADAYGNAIIRTMGGAKIIAVGQAGLAESFAGPQVVEASGTVNHETSRNNCREVGIFIKGRSYMYGVSDGDPVPRATKIVCDTQ